MNHGNHNGRRFLIGLAAGVGGAATLGLVGGWVGEPGTGGAEPEVAEEIAPEAAPEVGAEPAFELVRRAGSVDLAGEYDLAGLLIPEGEIHTLLPRDAIPALTDPARESAREADWLPGDARILVVRAGGEVLGVPLRVLNWHEIVNTTVGGEPVAATYCPLCDSATVFSRRFEDAEGEAVVLEFGVSGALYNSNVLMYDRTGRGLWSQLAMRAVSGPMAGTEATMLPVEIVPMSMFLVEHPFAEVVGRETGHERDYTVSPYKRYFGSDGLMVPVRGVGDAMARKTLGVGIAFAGDAWFVPVEAIGGEGVEIETGGGVVRLERAGAGVRVSAVPEGVQTAQTFYYSWSAFYPRSVVVGE